MRIDSVSVQKSQLSKFLLQLRCMAWYRDDTECLGMWALRWKLVWVLDLVRMRRQSFGRALGEMSGNLWIVSHLWLGDYEKIRGNLMCLVVFVWAC